MARIEVASSGNSTPSSSSKGRGAPVFQILVTLASCCASFYAGMMVCTHACMNGGDSTNPIVSLGNKRCEQDDDEIEALVNIRVKQIEENLKNEFESHASITTKRHSASKKDMPRFPAAMSAFAQGAARISKKDFTQQYDGGNPIDFEGNGKSEVLILFGHENALPNAAKDAAMHGDENGEFPLLSSADATNNCVEMNVVFTESPRGSLDLMCLAIVPNYQSHHVQRWAREVSNSHGDKVPNMNKPMAPIGRGTVWKTQKNDMALPTRDNIKRHWKALSDYMRFFDDILAELGPIAEKIAIDNTIIVMTCNLGQSDLLMNFVCTAKSRGINLGNVLVFPTDEETQILAEGLGLATYYDERNFQSMPKTEAVHYGDSTFERMMMAKVYCVHLLLSLDFNVLFSDVDVVLFKNPIEFFNSKSNEAFDIIMQDDGSRTVRYAAYCGNTGFYFVRNNKRTKHLFNSLLYTSDVILEWDSHQQSLVQLISEHASLFNLRPKIMNTRTSTELPGGWHYHRDKNLMKQLVKGDIDPYIFHMSWTSNKDNKLKFLQQLGEWHVSNQCKVDASAPEVVSELTKPNKISLSDRCCLADPERICHYRDKPSKWPCKESPPLDKGVRSFW
uniref:Nucleotide-diphospho-sugar transferase domain-containing protein n=1 Tax=Odontella aurita TaxID=265563 RepID=A0A6U6D339_9STRA|mmetsp:Transcript_17758/g.51673  ORF Transcript_17758/g.51673 Transcript_17758/m.51673 type:complete len:618 (+) Transcript_17758:26-1879(+)